MGANSTPSDSTCIGTAAKAWREIAGLPAGQGRPAGDRRQDTTDLGARSSKGGNGGAAHQPCLSPRRGPRGLREEEERGAGNSSGVSVPSIDSAVAFYAASVGPRLH